MGPISTHWYEDNNIPYYNKCRYSKWLNEWFEYKDYRESYSCGRLDIYGVPDEPFGLEYGLNVMRTEDWNALGDWLWDFSSKELLTLDELLKLYGKPIRWHKDRL